MKVVECIKYRTDIQSICCDIDLATTLEGAIHLIEDSAEDQLVVMRHSHQGG